jgi:hypothetical protein
MPAVCRVFIQQQLSGQSEEISFRGPVWSEVQDSAVLGSDWREEVFGPDIVEEAEQLVQQV